MPKGQGTFGHQALAEQLSKRLQRQFRSDSVIDSSLVIGIFGEWGSGKSNVLHLIQDEFSVVKQEENTKQAPVIVVPFNPWRYEKEEHLLVPLLKNMELVIEQHIQKHETFWERLKLLDRLQESARFLGVSSLAFLQAFKGKFTPIKDVLEVEFNPKEFINGVKENGKKSTEIPVLDRLESYYFEFEHRLREYTTGENSFRLLFLIDDLDRCLPEKAVEMLESIKLFLDVDGCAFVLALDDEVVERGIIHRYRDYIFQGNDVSIKEETLAQMPITGPEYLEKIISLPFRLPQPSRFEIRQFLRKRFPELFDEQTTDLAVDVEEAKLKQSRQFGRDGYTSIQANELLNLFVNHIPPVPRKQIRAAELVLLLLDMAKARNCDQQIKPLPLAMLTFLQLFAPDVYRFGRRRYRGVMQLLSEWSKDPEWGRKSFFGKLQNTMNPEKKDANKEITESQQVEARNFDRYYAPILKALEASAHNRSGFDPFAFIKNNPLSESDKEDLRIYFSFVDEATLQAEENKAEILARDTRELLIAELSNSDEFLDLLFAESPSAWQSAVQIPELEGRVVSHGMFIQIRDRLAKGDFKSRLGNIQWLNYLIPHLSFDNFSTLAEDSHHFIQVLPKNLPNPASDDNCDDVFAKAKLLTVMRSSQQQILGQPVESIRQWLCDIVEKKRLSVKKRAKAARLLSAIGDPRFGVGVIKRNGSAIIRQRKSKQHHVPEFDWQKITAGTLQMGLTADEKKNSWDQYAKPIHNVDISSFFMSRYPVTNAQYRCFLDAGMYEDDDFWETKLPNAAILWRHGDMNEKLVETLKDKDQQKRYRNWLKTDKERHRPRYWKDEKWNLDNHPVVGISWFEAFAYSVWLNDYLADIKPKEAKNNVQIYLPTEAEWEYAARGEDGLKYAWGNEADEHLANYHDTDIGQTSAVGLFSAGKAHGLHDMSGNTWEWTMSRWGENLDQPDFTYKKWKAQEATRDLPETLDARIIRGGAFNGTSDYLRCAIRIRNSPGYRSNYIGFRLVVIES